MINREELELSRLEVNTHRLMQLVRSQADTISQLRQRLSEQNGELESLRQAVRELRHNQSMSQIASALASGQDAQGQARAYLADIIKEVEYCIAQLEAQ